MSSRAFTKRRTSNIKFRDGNRPRGIDNLDVLHRLLLPDGSIKSVERRAGGTIDPPALLAAIYKNDRKSVRTMLLNCLAVVVSDKKQLSFQLPQGFSYFCNNRQAPLVS